MSMTTTTTTSERERLLDQAASPRARLYALLDAARAPEGIAQANEAGASITPLLAGPGQQPLQDVAPYIIDFRPGSSFRRWWFEQWADHIGLVVEAPVRSAELRRHLRTLLVVHGPEGKRYYFRFYDPRVLRTYLPSCSAEEVRRFFGPMRGIYCEGTEPGGLLCFRPGPDGLVIGT